MNKKTLAPLLVLSLLASNFSYASSSTSIDQLTKQVLQYSHIQQKNLTTEELEVFINQAKARHHFLLDHLDKPATLTQFLLPADLTKAFIHSNQVAMYFEKEVKNIEGRLEIVAAMYLDGRQQTIQYLLYHNNQTYRLHFADTPPNHLQTDMIIKIKHGFEIPTKENIHEVVLSADDIEIVKKVSALPLSFGPQTYLSMLVNFSDKPTDRPWTSDTVKNLMFTTVNNFYKEASYGRTSIVGQQQNWVVINLQSTVPCDNNIQTTLRTLADQKAAAAGVDLSKFPRRAYFFPKVSSCSWAGLGTVGGANSWVLLNGYANTIFTAHEIGHNMGLWHAQSLRCTSPIEGSCTTSEYGDGTDSMGNINAGHFNAAQKDRLGWLNYETSPPITTVTQSGSYFIDAYETNTKLPKALKILKRSGQSVYYYLELRQPVGFDSVLANCGSNCDFTKGIVFHQGNPSASAPTQLLDMTPGGGTQLVALLPCKSWRDADAPNGGVTFTVQSISPQGARVKITYGSGTDECVHQAPTVQLSPHQTQWLSKDETGTYRLTIKNNDSGKCAPRNFSLPNIIKNEIYSIQLSAHSVKIAPNKSRTIQVAVKSFNKGTPQIQPISLSIKNDIDKMPVNADLLVGVK